LKNLLTIILLTSGVVSAPILSADINPFEGYSKAYKVCLDKAVSTADTIECTNAEYKQQDKRLNIAYNSLKSKQTPARVKQLTELQKLWIKYRDANCAFYYDLDGGSMARVLANDCMLTMTKDRATEFEGMLKSWAG
jgi:uncharacterized protein YecT (DUF1311 family)